MHVGFHEGLAARSEHSQRFGMVRGEALRLLSQKQRLDTHHSDKKHDSRLSMSDRFSGESPKESSVTPGIIQSVQCYE